MTASAIVRLRVNVLDPPRDVTWRLQRGRTELVEPVAATSRRITFEFELRVGTRPGGLPNFLGDFAQGPPAARFVYVNSGTYAGQAGSRWARRAKVPLTGISQRLIDQALNSNGILAADIDGTARDGGPCCATVPLDAGWRVET